MNAVTTLPNSSDLTQSAERIRGLMVDAANNSISLGHELLKVREKNFPRGLNNSRPGWKEWLKSEFDISERTARKFIQVADRFGPRRAELPAATNVLALLSGAIPESAEIEITRRLKAGEKIGERKARKIIDENLPSPSKARKQARETGRPVAATDGYVYFGATKEEEEKIELRRSIVFGVRRAVESLSAVPMSPHEFLKYALPHQLWNEDEGPLIEKAADWLWALHVAWGRRK